MATNYVDTLRRRVRESGESQEVWGRRLGVGQTAVSHFVCGARTFRAPRLIEIAKELGLEIRLVEVKQEPEPVPTVGTVE